ncbi:MAG: transporter substrate-binding domain-containing protein [Candidatus Margulisiibacteriota bacterium]
MRSIVKITVVLFAVLLVANQAGLCQTDTAKVNIQLTAEEKAFLAAHAPIRIGIMNNWPPLNYLAHNGQPAGLGVDYLKAINQRLDNALVIEPAPFRDNYEKVKNRQLDALMDITPKPERLAFFEFTKPYLAIPHVIVGRKGDPYFSSENDLKGKTVALEKGYYNITHFRQNYPEVKIREYGSTGDALDAVAREEADAYAGNRAVAIYLIEKEVLSNLDLEGRLSIPPSELTIGVRKDWPILAVILNKALAAVPESERAALNAHFITSFYEPWYTSRQFWTIVLISIGVVVLIGLFSLIWNRALRQLVELRTKELQESERKYRALVENAGQLIMVLQDAQIKYINGRSVDLFGRQPAEVLNRPFIDFVDQADQKLVAENYAKRMRGENVPAYPFRVMATPGVTKWVEVSGVRFEWQGKPATLVFLTDITERKRAEEKEIELVKIRELDRMKSLFIASMSHELRTPLNSIIGFTGILLMGMTGELSEEQKKQLGMVKSSASHLLALINDVIDVSKIEAEKIQLSIEEFNLPDTIQGIRDTFLTTLEERGHKLTLDIPAKLPVKSDERRVKQIIMNLVSNAAKFMEKGEIVIRAAVKGNKVEVSVSDTGYGIRAEDMPKLFQQFSRIFTEGQPLQEGTGLGLYLSQKLAGILGGVIKAESEFKQGSTFTFILPLDRQGGKK